MDIILGLLGLAFAGFLLYISAIVLGAAGLLLIGGWPLIAGVIGGIYIWRYHNDNYAVIFFIVCIVVQVLWLNFFDGGGGGRSTSDPMSGKKAIYDKEGKVKGYMDSD